MTMLPFNCMPQATYPNKRGSLLPTAAHEPRSTLINPVLGLVLTHLELLGASEPERILREKYTPTVALLASCLTIPAFIFIP